MERYKTADTLKALKIESNRYKFMLKNSKISVLSVKVEECGKDSKKLYKLVTELTGGPKENPLPNNIDDEDLANKFANFFLDKIKRIGCELENYTTFKPQQMDSTQLNHFPPE